MSSSYNLYGTDCLNDDLITIEVQCTQDEYDSIQQAADEKTFIGKGLTDLQVNGYKGVDFNGYDLSSEEVRRITLHLLYEGVTSYLPTIITDRPAKINQKIRRIMNAIKEDPLVIECINGIHLEGPFISPLEGPRGAHPKEFVIEPDWDLFNQWQETAEGHIRLITLSPEWPGAMDFIEKCVDSEVKVAIGHTACTPEQIHEAVDAGATLSTHLGNGMHNMIPRFPNYLWSQLAADKLYASVIADGFHLPPDVLKVILKIKNEKLFLVSDSVALGGMSAGEYNQHVGGKVVLTGKGKLHLKKDSSQLAGSACSLLRDVEYLVTSGLFDLKTAWGLASVRPLQYLGKQTNNEDYVVFNKSEIGEIKAIATIKGGKVYKKLNDSEL